MKLKKMISILLTIALLIGVMPQFVSASTTVNIDVSSVSTDGTGYTCSALTVNNKTEYVVTITDNGTYELTGTSDHPNDETHPTHVVVAAESANIILNGVHISLYNFSPLSINPGSTVNLTIAEGTTNTLTTAASTVAFAGMFVPTDATVIVSGTGTLNASGCYDGGAGIGGGKANGNANAGIITINSGIINATGGPYGAGIGGGSGGSGGAITINGGNLNVLGGLEGAGIGGGSNGDSGTIAINGGTVNATGGADAAGIGGGFKGNGNVTISGGTVIASAVKDGSGIGGGTAGYNEPEVLVGGSGNVTITGGIITAYGSQYGAGIGGGIFGSNNRVDISGGIITATGTLGAGIGGAGATSSHNASTSGADITISGGTITATSSLGVGIGRGVYSAESSTNMFSGGSIKSSSINPVPMDGTNSDYLTTVTVTDNSGSALTNKNMFCLMPSGVSFDAVTDGEGKLYLWLPESNDATVALASDGINYKATGNITNGSNSLTAIQVTVSPISVTSVEVTAPTVEVQKGTTQTFNAVVEGENNPEQTVIWSVAGGIAGTSIDSNGVLTIAGNESASTLTITAISTVDITKSGSATVTVKPKQITVIPDAGQIKAYGTSTDPEITYTVTPALQNGESLSGSLSRTAGESVGDYEITQGSLVGGSDYEITFVTEVNFTISRSKPTILFTAVQNSGTEFGENNVTMGVRIEKKENGDIPSGSVIFKNDDTVIGSCVLNEKGEGSITATIVAGDHKCSAEYSGNDNYNETMASVSITVVDKAVLQSVIDDATSLKNSAVAGSEKGQYPQEAIDSFAAAIENAISVRNNDGALQEVVNQAKTELELAINDFRTKQISEEATPTVKPTETPTVAPTGTPTVAPNGISTSTPTVAPNNISTTTPTVAPTGTSTVTTKVTVKKPSIKVTAGSRKVIIKWKKIKSVSGYEIKMAKSKKAKYTKIKTVKSKIVKYTKKSLIKGKKYYFKVRAYKVVNGKKIYSKYSAVKSIKVK